MPKPTAPPSQSKSVARKSLLQNNPILVRQKLQRLFSQKILLRWKQEGLISLQEPVKRIAS